MLGLRFFTGLRMGRGEVCKGWDGVVGRGARGVFAGGAVVAAAAAAAAVTVPAPHSSVHAVHQSYGSLVLLHIQGREVVTCVNTYRV